MEKLEEKKKQLQKEQDVLSNSINSLKNEKNQLEDKAKYLKDLITEREIFIKSSEKNEIKAREDLNKLLIEVEVKQKECDLLNGNSEKLSVNISELNWEILELQKSYNEKQRECDNQVKAINDKVEKQKVNVADSFNDFKNGKDKEKVLIQETINALNKKNKALETQELILKSSNKNLEELNEASEKELVKLTNDKKILEEDIKKLDDKKENLNNSLELVNDNFVKENEKLLILQKETKEAQKKLDKVLTKTAFIVRKEDHLKGFEEYIKEVSGRLGLNYEPYE